MFYYQQNANNKPVLNPGDLYPNNTKEYVKVLYHGIEVYFDNELVIYINFGNLDLSKFALPLNKIASMEEGPFL